MGAVGSVLLAYRRVGCLTYDLTVKAVASPYGTRFALFEGVVLGAGMIEERGSVGPGDRSEGFGGSRGIQNREESNRAASQAARSRGRPKINTLSRG